MRIKRKLRAISVAADGRLIATDGSREHPAAQLWAPPRFSGLVIRLSGEGRVHVIIGQGGVVNQIVGDGLMAIFLPGVSSRHRTSRARCVLGSKRG